MIFQFHFQRGKSQRLTLFVKPFQKPSARWSIRKKICNLLMVILEKEKLLHPAQQMPQRYITNSIVQTAIVREPATEPASRLPLSAATVSGHGRGPHLKVQINIRRKPLYYGYTIVAPTLVLCALNLFSFLLPCDNGNKVGIGLTVFLSLYVLQLAIAKNIPESNTLPLIGRKDFWLTFVFSSTVDLLN